uniref:uncharacterized protein C2orf81 homolog n=1 Tax=Oncorhynchus gorbuscha TaxID=8017 RepID=UPI001EAF657C|nr:uncharacterized protein C2orf81 homolog [Oncorhynchus gorbuscha]
MSRAASKSRAEKGRTNSAPAPPPPPSQSPDVVDIVPGRLTESNWVSMLVQEEGEEVVVEVLYEFMNHIMEKCYTVYLQRQPELFTTSWARDSLVQILEWQFLVQDEGEGPDSAPSWEEDSEPLPSTTDSWAQGCVQVLQVKPTKYPSPLQMSSPVGEAAGQTGHRANHKTHTVSQLSSSPKHSRKDRKAREPPGFRGFKLSPAPPPITEGGTWRQHHTSPTTPTEDYLQSPRHSLNSSVTEEEEYVETCPNISVQSAKLCPQRGGLPSLRRLDLARLPRHRVWPQYEVLDASPSKRHPLRTGGPLAAGQNLEKQHTTQTKAMKPLTNDKGPSMAQRRSALTGAVSLTIKRRSIPHGGNSEGIVPFSGTLMLDSMELAPGVTLKGPQGTRFSPLKGCPAQLEHSAELRPIRNNLPVPLFSLEQLTAGPDPQVNTLI